MNTKRMKVILADLRNDALWLKPGQSPENKRDKRRVFDIDVTDDGRRCCAIGMAGTKIGLKIKRLPSFGTSSVIHPETKLKETSAVAKVLGISSEDACKLFQGDIFKGSTLTRQQMADRIEKYMKKQAVAKRNALKKRKKA